jgi:hypothetical protein
MTRDEMLNMLRDGVCEVKFEKKDGTMRDMRCTLNQMFIPEEFTPKSGSGNENTDTVRVFEVPVNQWRSFRVDTVQSFAKVD